jgi:Uma2 family endonuclease
VLYLTKLQEYQVLGIQEYWIVDYSGSGGQEFTGNPKQPTFTVCSLVDGEYNLQSFKKGDRILSPTFPELDLTVDRVFAVGT